MDGLVTVGSNVPVFQNCPDPITVDNSPGDCGNTVNWTPPTVCDCDNNAGTIMDNGITPGFLTVGTHTVIYTVTDSDANGATCSFDVVINDTECSALTVIGHTHAALRL